MTTFVVPFRGIHSARRPMFAHWYLREQARKRPLPKVIFVDNNEDAFKKSKASDVPFANPLDGIVLEKYERGLAGVTTPFVTFIDDDIVPRCPESGPELGLLVCHPVFRSIGYSGIGSMNLRRLRLLPQVISGQVEMDVEFGRHFWTASRAFARTLIAKTMDEVPNPVEELPALLTRACRKLGLVPSISLNCRGREVN